MKLPLSEAPRARFLLILTIFFASGAAALIYELLWTRHLGLILSNTVYAATAVFAAYMAGLAIGSALWGRRCANSQYPLMWFAAFQLGIGLYGLLMPTLFRLIRQIYRLLYPLMESQLTGLQAIRFLMAFGILIVPTVCMGGTLPALSQAVAVDKRGFGNKIGLLYGVNTLGAALGVLLAGFLLLEHLGLSRTNGLAVLLSMLAAVAAWAIGAQRLRDQDVIKANTSSESDSLKPPYAVLLAAAIAGAIALALEVIWFRALILVFGSTTYSFSAMLAIYLLGIGLGSTGLGWITDRIRSPVIGFGFAESLIGVFTLYSLRWFNRAPFWILEWLKTGNFSFGAMTVARFALALLFLFVPTVLMGWVFACAARAVREHTAHPSSAVGQLYAWNTIGGMVGSLVAGLALLPLLGMESSLIFCSIVALLLGAFIILTSPSKGWAAAFSVLLPISLAVATYATHPGWSRKLLASGPYFAPWQYVSDSRVTLLDHIRSSEILYYQESVVANVSVIRSDDGKLYFSSDGKVEADTSPRSLMLQRMMGHLPMLFHDNPQRVLNIGLGAGTTFGALSCYPASHLEVVEIEPAVLQVAEFFGRWNHDVMSRSNVIITIGDGRNHLFCTTNRYDVITSDPFEPVYSGANHLYTVEHFQQARARLNAGGIMCQYLPLYELSPRDFTMIVRSFVHVFPHTVMFYTGDDTVLLGFTEGLPTNLSPVRQKLELPSVKASLSELGLDSLEELLGMCVADLRNNEVLPGEGPLNTDDRPYVEFSAPRHALRYTNPENLSLLQRAHSPLPAEWLAELTEEELNRWQAAHAAMSETLEGIQLQFAGDASGAFRKYLNAHEAMPDHPIINDLIVSLITTSADNLRMAGELEEAIYQYNMVLRFRPNDFMAHFHLVDLLMKTGRPDPAGQLLNQALQYYPDSALLLGFKGRYAAAVFQDFLTAKRYLQQAVTRAPWKPELWRDYAAFSEASGDILTAVAAQQIAEQLEKRPLANSIEK